MSDDTEVIDSNGQRITVGAHTRCGGVVTGVSDPDGDVDDEGRPYGINPSVHVQYDDCDDSYPTGIANTWDVYMGAHAIYRCDEVDVVAPASRPTIYSSWMRPWTR